MVAEENVSWIVNTPSEGPKPMVDEIRMRSEAVIHGVPITTTIDALEATVSGLEALKAIDRMDVRTLQEYHRYVTK